MKGAAYSLLVIVVLSLIALSSAFAQDNKPAPRQEAHKVQKAKRVKVRRAPKEDTRINYKPRNPKYDGCRTDPRFEHC